VLAAYLRPFRHGGAAAENGACLATAVIASAGGHHLLLGEGDGVLREPYYPDHGALSDDGRRRMQALYDHTAALHAYLFDGRAVDRSRTYANGENPELALRGVAAASEPTAGAVWLAISERPDGSLVIHLVDLVDAGDDLWNAPKPVAARPRGGLTLKLGASFRAPRVVWRDAVSGVTVELAATASAGAGATFALPQLELWATLVVVRG
jgi:dextranase